MSGGYKNISGVYIITNKTNNKIYIGSAIYSIPQRLSNHKRELKYGKHRNSHLQKAYDKYGEENFTFEILEEWPLEYCISMEQWWTNMLNACNRDKGYNIAPVAGNSYGQKRTPKQCENISNAKKGKTKGKDNHRFGTTWSKETREKILNSTRNKSVYQLDLQNNIIKEFKSLSIAGKEISGDSSFIGKVCNGIYKTAYGFKWKFKQ